MNYKFVDCNQLVLMTSESCNLQCAYCEMAKMDNAKKHINETKKVKESLTNGQYLQTINDMFKRLNLNKDNITTIELWGQEPTLTLKEFTQFYPELFKICPNINQLFFSTNGVGFTSDIINFIKLISQIIVDDFNLGIQFSYDGKDNTKSKRGVNPEIIINNIEKLIIELNNVTLNNKLNIRLNFHNVIDNDIIIHYAENTENLFNYLNEFELLNIKFKTLNKNPQVDIGEFSPGLISPFNATVEEGQALAKFYQNCELYGQSLNFKWWKGICHMIFSQCDNFPFLFTKVPSFLQEIKDGTIGDNYLSVLSHNTTCGFSTNAIKIRYDGTLLPCHSFIFGLNDVELEGKTSLQYIINKEKKEHNFFPNIYSSSDEDLDKYYYYIDSVANEAFPLKFSMTLNLLQILLYSKQINNDYEKDQLKLLRHAYYLTLSNGCPYNDIIETGSLIGRTSGWIRFLANGFLDICDKEYQIFRENKNDN